MKQYLKLLVCFVLSAGLMISPGLQVVSYADVNDLLINTDSNALMTMELDDVDYGIMPLSSLGTVTNTVTGNFAVIAWYRNPDGVVTSRSAIPQLVDGRYEFKILDGDLPAGYYLYCWEIWMDGKNLPPPGSYALSFDFASDFSVVDYTAFSLMGRKLVNNATQLQTVKSLNSYMHQESGDLYLAPFNINLTNLDRFIWVFDVPFSHGYRNVAGSLAFNFTKVDSGNYPTFVGSDTSDEDYQSDVSSSLSDLSSSVDSMTEDLSSAAESLEYISSSQNLIIQGIDNVIMHISDQLYAFWDQLYNLIHEPTMAKMDEIIEAIENVDLQIDVDLDELKTSINNMSQAVQNKLQSVQDGVTNKIQDTTDHITGGYDNSGMSSDKDRLDSSIQDYDEAENDLVSDARDNIDEFVFDLDLSEFIGPIQDISFFMQGIFETMGPMNVAVSFSLMLSVALVLIGWYRFKSGG